MNALPVVETGSGRVRGCGEGGLAVFRGVPFAEPPVGALRLAPPRPPAPWAGVRDALAFGPAAPQRVGIGLRLVGAADLRTDEDCLTLNVWTPAADAGKRPVLVFVHGGSYVSGAGSVTVLEGASLARRGDVVVVTLNYRLGALGFLGLDPDGKVRAGNLALRDQIRALEWVQGNVERFGGDPRRVTVFGESAGSMSLGVLLGVACARGLFGRAILQSGAPAASSPAEAERVVHALCRELGVEPDDGTRLRELPVERFVEAQDRAAAHLWRELSGLPFQPVVDGELVPAAPREGLRAGGAQGVEILVGTNLDECRYFGLADPKARQLTDAALLRRCAHHIPGHEAGVAHAERVVTGYRRHRAARSVSTAPPDLWFAIETDRLFRVPSAALAELHAGLGSSAYMYLFTWASPALEGALGACHALELPFVFGTVGLPGVRWLVGEGAEALSERMQEVWIGFAREGRPDGAHWPAYHAERRSTFLFGRECGLAEAPFDAERRLWAGLVP